MLQVRTSLILFICLFISFRYEQQSNENGRINPLMATQRLNEIVTKSGSLQGGQWTHSANDENKYMSVVCLLLFYNILGK